MAIKVYLIYSEADSDFVQQLQDDLIASGIEYFADDEASLSTDEIVDRYFAGLAESDAVLVCASPDALFSEFSRKEIFIARSYKKRIIPLLIVQPDEEERFQLEQFQEVSWLFSMEWIRFDEEYSHGLITLINLLLESARQRDNQPHVYISYSRPYKDEAKKLQAHLDGAQITTWADYEKAPLSDTWRDEMFRAMEKSYAFLACVTNGYMESEVFRQEILVARSRRIPIFRLLFDDTPSRKDEHMEARWLRTHPAFDFRADYAGALSELIAEIPSAPNRLTPRKLRSDSMVGLRVGPYEFEEFYARGGMGNVYRGRHVQLNRPVAIKILPEDFADNPDSRARFEREAKTVASLRHPNIVHVYDFSEIEGIFYLVMEFITGKELRIIMRERGPLPISEVSHIISDLGSALDYAHAAGIVHRDIKPSNIMIQSVTDSGSGRNFRAVLMDFGIARVASAETKITQTGTVGTLEYMAPEQIMMESDIDHRADIYSLGIILYQMLTGQMPFADGSLGQMLLAHLQDKPVDPRNFVPEIPEYAAKAVLRALAKKPAERWQSAGELAAALNPS